MRDPNNNKTRFSRCQWFFFLGMLRLSVVEITSRLHTTTIIVFNLGE